MVETSPMSLENKVKHLHKDNAYITFEKSCIIHTYLLTSWTASCVNEEIQP